ncbi:MAG TPA: alcohol dehydrogenase catalytic domain-containing protein, partial [Thermoplasmata archaeon]|nr:alcohol dehydrogenase catalytic domain-containing protein [Thermoplasmata archaeon]
ICGSDVLEWYRIPKAPIVLGHEIAAEVAEVGGEVHDWAVGDRVFVSHHVPCEECRYCTSGHETVCETLRRTNFDPGGFAEYVRVPEINVKHGVFRIPEALTYEEGTFIEPLGCAVRGQRAGGLPRGRAVLVLGSGIAGLLHVRLARANGAAKVFATDIQDVRLAAARSSGTDAVWRATEDVAAELRGANRGELADLVIVSTGAVPAIRQAFDCVAPGGAVLFFAPSEPGPGIPIPFNDLWRNEVTMMSTYGAAPRDIRESIELLETRRVRVADLITHRLPLSEAARGFALVASGGESLKVVLGPHR